MPIARWWHDAEKTIWIEDYTAPWTWSEYHQNLDDVKGMLLRTPYKPIYLVHQISSLPIPGGRILTHLQRSFEALTENVPLNIMVFNISTPGKNQFGATMFQIALKLFDRSGQTIMLASIDQAITQIEKHRTKRQGFPPEAANPSS